MQPAFTDHRSLHGCNAQTLKAVHVALEPIMCREVEYAQFCQTRMGVMTCKHSCLQQMFLQPILHATNVVSKCMQHYSQYLGCNLTLKV